MEPLTKQQVLKMSSLPKEKPVKGSDKEVKSFFNTFFSKNLTFPATQVDAVVGFFLKRNFDKEASIAVGTTLLQQAKLDGVNVFKLLDTLKGLTDVQLSVVVTEILNYNRAKTSTLGFKREANYLKFERRNIVP